MLRKQTKQKIDELFAAGFRPAKLRTTEGIGLREGLARRAIILVDSAGKTTTASFYYEQKSGQDLQPGGFLQQVARREGTTASGA